MLESYLPRKKKVPLNNSKVEYNFLESESHFVDSLAISGDLSNFIHCTKIKILLDILHWKIPVFPYISWAEIYKRFFPSLNLLRPSVRLSLILMINLWDNLGWIDPVECFLSCYTKKSKAFMKSKIWRNVLPIDDCLYILTWVLRWVYFLSLSQCFSFPLSSCIKLFSLSCM